MELEKSQFATITIIKNSGEKCQRIQKLVAENLKKKKIFIYFKFKFKYLNININIKY